MTGPESSSNPGLQGEADVTAAPEQKDSKRQGFDKLSKRSQGHVQYKQKLRSAKSEVSESQRKSMVRKQSRKAKSQARREKAAETAEALRAAISERERLRQETILFDKYGEFIASCHPSREEMLSMAATNDTQRKGVRQPFD
jgi:phage protein D